jgi:hypothetical protein
VVIGVQAICCSACGAELILTRVIPDEHGACPWLRAPHFYLLGMPRRGAALRLHQNGREDDSVPVPIEVAPPVFARALSSGGAFRPRGGAHGSEATRALRGEGTRVQAAKAPVLFVVGCRLLFALGFFGACNPRHSDFHQYRFVLFRCSLRQTAAFCRIFAEAASVTVHDTFHLSCSKFGCSMFRLANRELLGPFRFKSSLPDGTKSAIQRSSRALTWGAA